MTVRANPEFDVRASLDHCVKCTVCESACPVAAVTELFPGPKTVGPQAERFRAGAHSPDISVDYCSGCGVCSRVCPQGVRIAEINSRARAQLKSERGVPLRDQLLARPGVMGKLGRPVAPIFNWAIGSSAMRMLAERTVAIHHLAPAPRVVTRTFSYWMGRRRSRTAGPKVVYFHGCSTQFFEPEVGKKVVAILEHNGFQVVVPKQDCCGLPLQSNGIFGAARQHLIRLARQLSVPGTEGLPVIASSTSCGLMLKREGMEILGVEDEHLRAVSRRTYDIFEFLLELHQRGELRTDFQPVPLTIAYHAPCQQQNQEIGKPALDILALIPGLRLVELDRYCCGIAGTYGTKREKYEISMRVGEPLFADIRDASPDLVTCDSETCRWQIAKATGVTAAHPLEVLHRAYGGS
ncbi:MAG: anaerobic glycerol-3-phosphate dehydrogenase subunit C [Candidatus Dormibacteria bacterium]